MSNSNLSESEKHCRIVDYVYRVLGIPVVSILTGTLHKELYEKEKHALFKRDLLTTFIFDVKIRLFLYLNLIF